MGITSLLKSEAFNATSLFLFSPLWVRASLLAFSGPLASYSLLKFGTFNLGPSSFFLLISTLILSDTILSWAGDRSKG